MRQLLTLIIPLYNEQDTLDELFHRVDAVCGHLDLDTEKILIDNRSTDRSREVCLQKCEQDQSYRYLRLSRNFGPAVDSSLAAGLSIATGDAAVILYSDLQDPPEVIPEMVQKWRQGADVVYGVHSARLGEAVWRRSAARLFYRLMHRFSDVNLPADAGDFRLISRRVIDHLKNFEERARYTRGLVTWIGFDQQPVTYERSPRKHGRSKANPFAITRTAFTALTSFSLGPLRLITAIGSVVSACAFSLVVLHIAIALLGRPIPGLTTIITINLMSLGLIMLAIGVLGEYLGRLHTEIKRRPLFIIDEDSGD